MRPVNARGVQSVLQVRNDQHSALNTTTWQLHACAAKRSPAVGSVHTNVRVRHTRIRGNLHLCVLISLMR